jgi:hypothetical protein
MAVAGLGMSLPAAATAAVDVRLVASRGSLHDVFGFEAAATQPPAAAVAAKPEDALARLAALGLVALPPAEPRTAWAAPATIDTQSHASVEARADGSPAKPASGAVEASHDDADGRTIGQDADALVEATSAESVEAPVVAPVVAPLAAVAPASVEAAADAMANALALVTLVDESAPGDAPAPSSAVALSFLRGPTAGRPPRTAADAHIEPWALPVATALPGFDVDLCRIDPTLPERDASAHAAPGIEPGVPFDLDLWAHAMQEPFGRDVTNPVPADEPAMHAGVDIDVDGIGIGAELDIDLGRPTAQAAAQVDIDLGATAGSDLTAAVDIDLGRALALGSAAVDIAFDVPTAAAPSVHADAALEPARPGGSVLGIAVADAVSEAKLDRVRGGFSAAGGLQVSFGIERAVYVNGALVTTTSLNVNGLGNTTAGPPTASATPSQIALVQNGAGNTFLTGSMDAAALGTVVQNTLNNQKIQTVTLINATVNSLQIIKSMNIGSSLRGAMIDSLRR